MMTSLRELLQPTAQWRSNAIRVNNKDGENSEFEYVQVGKEEKLTRRRKTNLSPGFDNLGIQE